IDALQATLRNPVGAIDATGYPSAQVELQVAMGYKDEIDAGLSDTSFSKLLYQRQQAILRELLTGNDIDKFVNFGVSYAYVDSLLAKQFPHVKFIGVDRAAQTKQYNEFIFGTVQNLRFEAADIRSFLKNEKAANGILFHARTAVYVARSILEEIYAVAL